MENCLSNARLLSKSLEATGWYTCVSDIHRKIKDASDKDDETSADYGMFNLGENTSYPGHESLDFLSGRFIARLIALTKEC